MTPSVPVNPGVWEDWGCLWLMAIPEGDAHAVWFTRHGTAFAHCPKIIARFGDAYGLAHPSQVPSGKICPDCGATLISQHHNPVTSEEMYEFVTSGTPVALWDCGDGDGPCATSA